MKNKTEKNVGKDKGIEMIVLELKKVKTNRMFESFGRGKKKECCFMYLVGSERPKTTIL